MKMSQSIISELKAKYEDKKIIPFIGAGLSIPFQLKSWPDLINELKETTLDTPYWPAIEHDLNLNEYQMAIEGIKKYAFVSDQPIQEKIAECYSKRKNDSDILVDCNYGDLVKKNFKVYLTTNYDRLIEDFIPEINSFNSLTDYTSNVQRLFMSDSEKYLFHIHGCVSNPDSIVISNEKYESLYSDAAFDNLMKVFSSSYSFLFLGFSFNDSFVKTLVEHHKQFFKGTHYLLIDKDSITGSKKKDLSVNYGIKILEYDISKSSHVEEIRKILAVISGEPHNVSDVVGVQSYPSIGIDDLISSSEEMDLNNLFYQKLELAGIGEKLKEVSQYFYIAAEKFIRTSKDFGLPKEFIDGILAEVFMNYKEKYIEIYDIEGKSSEELLIEIHKNLETINIDRLVEKSTKPTTSENKGFIHILADDAEKEVWWGSERL